MAKAKAPSVSRTEISVMVPISDEIIRGGGWILQGISVDTFKKEITEFASLISQSLEGVQKVSEGLSLDEVTLTATVSAKGKLTLFGSGVQAGGSGGLTFKFKIVRAEKESSNATK